MQQTLDVSVQFA